MRAASCRPASYHHCNNTNTTRSHGVNRIAFASRSSSHSSLRRSCSSQTAQSLHFVSRRYQTSTPTPAPTSTAATTTTGEPSKARVSPFIPRTPAPPPTRPLSVLIVGSGVAGLTLALSLKARGVHADLLDLPELFHKSVTNEDHAPEGVTIPPYAVRIFQRLGVANKLADKSVLLSRSTKLNSGGKTTQSIPLNQISPIPYLTLTYSDLLSVLEESAKERGIETLPARLTSLKQTDDYVRCGFSRSVPTKYYDIVVGADGAKSKIREEHFDAVKYKIKKDQGNWGCWSTYLDYNPILKRGESYQVQADGIRINVVPVSEKKVHLWATFNTAVATDRLNDGYQDPKELVTETKKKFASPQILRYLDSILESKKPIWHEFPVQLQMKTWINGRIVLIGDAAHTMFPFNGAGAAMAAEDAYILAYSLTEGVQKYGSLERALVWFMQQRYPRVYYFQQEAKRITKEGQLTSIYRLWHRFKSFFKIQDRKFFTMRRAKKFVGADVLPPLAPHEMARRPQEQQPTQATQATQPSEPQQPQA